MKKIRSSKFSKFLAYYLAIMTFLQVTQPLQMYALTSGPTQPEFNAFTPIGTSDMVDLASGDFNYNIPIMDVGGYPINLAYNSGVTMDQEASWVGLGWNLNVGQIERQVRGLPDDFRGDEILYENNTRDNVTVGMNLGANAAAFGWDGISLGVGLGIESNNYEGISFKPSFGVGFQLSDNVTVGMNLSSSVAEGATVSPSVSISLQSKMQEDCSIISLKNSLSLGLSSRKGVENLNLSSSVSRFNYDYPKTADGTAYEVGSTADGSSTTQGLGGLGGSISFNNQSYTPSKRIGYENTSFSFSAAVGGEVFGIEGQAQITGYGSYQKIHSDYKNRIEKAFGYENTEYKKSQSGVLDFNRENERTVTENTTALALTNYTYDIYSIDGQGVSGMFRPYRSQISNVYNDYVADFGSGKNFGVEIGLGQLVHGSGDFKTTPSYSYTGRWNGNNNVLPYFEESSDDENKIDYEPFTYKLVGGMAIDPEQEAIYENKIYAEKALRIGITGGNKNSSTERKFYTSDNPSLNYTINSNIKRDKRFLRNQLLQKVTAKEAEGDPFIEKNVFSSNKGHHTAGIKVVQTDGSSYVYGKSAYNTKKVEASFDVSGIKNQISSGNNTGLINYSVDGTSITGTKNSDRISDQYLNKITTPGYAHSYMLTAVLSSDYEDIDGNGPSLNDLGSYTQFDYEITNPNYKWRIPFQEKTATYNNGLVSKDYDQKGNYIYGEKELVYLNKIVTKTHVAFFDLEDRKDAIGVINENGGKGTGRMKKVKSIRLYSRPEITINGEIKDPIIDGLNVKPIKMAHFIYSYNLCGGPKLVNKVSGNITPNELSNNGGKLTLEKVYFTYRGSNMGKYTPYEFFYGKEKNQNLEQNYSIINDPINNPDYDSKGFDIWGKYKKNLGDGSVNSVANNTEFPYVNQDKSIADANIKAWSLKAIELPSGGVISIETESDDYQFVQNKKAMQMFQVVGCGNSKSAYSNNTVLYDGNNHAQYLYVKISDQNLSGYNANSFKNDYLGENFEKAIKFQFSLNMRGDNNWQYENITGYFEIDNSNPNNSIGIIPTTTGTYAAIKMKTLNRDGGANGNAQVNPISKTGWGFGRSYLNRIVYGLDDNPTERDFETIVRSLAGSIEAIGEIFTGPNLALQNNGCARIFKPNKSWLRLENPNGRKLGGGLRVKSIKLSDKWDNMLDPNATNGTNLNTMEYGQEYSYDDDNGKSSGVATFEPNSSAENALVEPLYNKSGNYAENIAAPMELNYIEKPFGENFYPSPRITYSKISVKNLDRNDNSKTLKKHATGIVVTRHYTSFDFPTLVTFTDVNAIPDITPNNIIKNLVANGNISVRNHLTMSQGFSIVTNDINGKIRSQEVFAEGQNDAISKIIYKYNIDSNGNIDNNMPTIDSKGNYEKRLIGLDYDMINDFNESYSKSSVSGFDANLASFLVPMPLPVPIFIPTVFPKNSSHENKLRTTVTTKHIHKTGILVEKIAYDLGSTVSTKNLAWDAESGQVLLTETVNEYDDHYYSFNYPAYWMYTGMGLASRNIGIEGVLKAFSAPTSPSNDPSVTNNPYFYINGLPRTTDLSQYFHLGDELYSTQNISSGDLSGLERNGTPPTGTKLWVVGFNTNKTGILLMDRYGNYINQCLDYDTFDFKIVRSGYRNLQVASMASVTSMINPLKDINGSINFDVNAFTYDGNQTSFNPRIINASAVVYKDFWRPQGEGAIGSYPEFDGNTTPSLPINYIQSDGNVKYPYLVGNPYIKNIKGDWRAEKSYAYLTGRNSGNGVINNTRNEGFYKKFSPFYQMINGQWSINETDWTYASSVTKYSPFGVELENKDALNRSSAAQYGYNYTLPMAVASNSKYAQMGFEGFEETVGVSNLGKHFSFEYNYLNEDTQNSHTGKKSIKIQNGQKVVLNRTLKTSVPTVLIATCPTSDINPSSCDIIADMVQVGVPINTWPNSGNQIACINNSNEQGYCFHMPVTLNGFQVQNVEIIPVDAVYYQSSGYSVGNGFSSINYDSVYNNSNPPYPVIVKFYGPNNTCCQFTIEIDINANGMIARPINYGSCTQ